MIEFRHLSKRFGGKLALDNLSFTAEPGRVTGFLGPNGSGKTTTMRILLGLETATTGVALVGGEAYGRIKDPMFQVGALLDARNAHPGRTGFDHLRALALTHGIPNERVEFVLEEVGLSAVASRRVGGYSLGMRQRLGIAASMLGDPAAFVFDEPVNGLDPDGVIWFRELVRGFAAEGRTVLLSSHLISEVALTADHVVIVGRGKVLADSPLTELARLHGAERVLLRSGRANELIAPLTTLGARVEAQADALTIEGLSAAEVGDVAARLGIPLSELRTQIDSLEDTYRQLTDSSVEYRTGS
ncbi:ATP-binding cassette domain-containing protein [Salinibacterium sp. SWN139]|uniref:ATP-binding cassette domain-containing protein n=1 Tax=Salinibacterium sp. SWN139 TaxID=2792055 RepID=UPI0018CFD82F|nr:ATP-binding cassette domain-containing protein [Salinibacterium sp. SWN139]MBH0054281.1 ATP-binding cassette domain-containing protein [Salinibacterium sp. SWN139]